MKRKPRSSNYNYEREYDDFTPPDRGFDRGTDNAPKKNKLAKTAINFSATTLAILAGVFILGIGIGMGFSSVNGGAGTGKIVTLSDLETKAPNAELCVQFGASAIVMDTRVFVTLNPLNVFVSQPTTRPGCVLRSNNWSILEQRGLVKSDQVRQCKQRMNTFGFTNTLENSPQIDCIYQNDEAKNLFLDQPGLTSAPENQKF